MPRCDALCKETWLQHHNESAPCGVCCFFKQLCLPAFWWNFRKMNPWIILGVSTHPRILCLGVPNGWFQPWPWPQEEEMGTTLASDKMRKLKTPSNGGRSRFGVAWCAPKSTMATCWTPWWFFVGWRADMEISQNYLGGGFKYFFIFVPSWGRFPIWLVFFKWVETTN